MKNSLIALIVLVLLGIGGYFLFTNLSADKEPVNEGGGATTTPSLGDWENPDQTTGEPAAAQNQKEEVIGTSTEGQPIKAYHYGTGDTELLFVGGIHGGYSWNTALVAYELIEHLETNPSVIPANVRVTVIPVLNPDGLAKAAGTAGRFEAADVSISGAALTATRFNANTVDLNRNFDCDWQTSGVWQNKTVSGGSAAFSEPESKAIRSYVESNDPTAVVVWYSAAGGVFASSCHNGVSAETQALTNTYAKASGYKAYQTFDFYEITGDMVNWLAKIGTPAISVLLTTHESTEWSKNRAGIEALLAYYAE